MYFEEEEVEPSDWAVSWQMLLLAKALPIENTLRLWDTYLTCEEGLELHTYVCLAILNEWRDDLMELEEAELKGFLQHLPVMDMDQVRHCAIE